MLNLLGEVPAWKEHCQADRAFVSVNILLHPWTTGAWGDGHRPHTGSLCWVLVMHGLENSPSTWSLWEVQAVEEGLKGGRGLHFRPNWTSHQGKSLEDEWSTGNVWDARRGTYDLRKLALLVMWKWGQLQVADAKQACAQSSATPIKGMV